MRATRTSNGVGRLLVPLLLLVATGCGGGGGGDRGGGGDAAELANRARQVARAWDGSYAADVWRAGFHINRARATATTWLFALGGYAAPLALAPALPSKLPEPPVENASGEVPGLPVRHLVRTTPDGRSVTVLALHGACDDGALVKARESGGSVVLSGYFKNPSQEGHCTKEAIGQRVTVRLARPLGDRVLLDAHTGRPIPVAGHPQKLKYGTRAGR